MQRIHKGLCGGRRRINFTGFAGVRYGGTLAPNVYFRAYAKYFDRDDEVFSNGTDASDSWRMAQTGFRIDTDPSSENVFTLQGDFYGGTENLATGDDAEVNGNNLLGRWSHTFAEDSDMTLQIYYDRTHLDDPIPANAFAGAGILTDDLDTCDVDFQHRFHLGERNHVVWGLGYRFTHNAIENAPALAFFPTTLNHNLFSGFLQNEITLLQRLSLTLGTKIEHNDYTGVRI